MEIGKEISGLVSSSVYNSTRNVPYVSVIDVVKDTVCRSVSVFLWDGVTTVVEDQIYYRVRNSVRDSVINPATYGYR